MILVDRYRKKLFSNFKDVSYRLNKSDGYIFKSDAQLKASVVNSDDEAENELKDRKAILTKCQKAASNTSIPNFYFKFRKLNHAYDLHKNSNKRGVK